MNKTENLFVELLRGFATDSIPQLNIENADAQELQRLAKHHSVQGIIAYMVNRCKLPLPDEAVGSLNKAYDRTVMQMLHRAESALLLCNKLTENNIPHILFKGLTLGECYPVKELRTYGDVDILVRAEDVQAVRELMAAMGFSHSIADKGVVNAFDKGREHYEFHTALNVSTIKGNDYFANMWEHTAVRSGKTCMFDHSFHLSYLIAHIEKHVYGSGAGIKMYLDIALYINKHREQIDLQQVREILENCGLEKFFNTVLYLCHRWFSLDIPQWVEALPEETYEQMCEFTLGGGIFGTEDKLTTALRRELSVGTKGAKLRVLLGRVFPSFYELSRIYPRYEGKPWLAPVAWVNHIYRVIKDRKLSRVKEIVSADISDSAKRMEFFESIGSKR